MDAPPNTSAGNEPPPGTQPATPPPEAPPSRTGWLPPGVTALAAGTAGGALVLAAVGLVSLFIDRDNGVRALEARLAALDLELRELAARPPPPAADPRALADVAGRVGTLEATAAAPRPPGTDVAVMNRLAAVDTEIKALAAAHAELVQKLARPQAPSVERGEIDALANRVAAVEHTEKSSESRVAKAAAEESGDRAVRLSLAATALKAAVERGDPFPTELATVKALAADPKLVAALEPFAASGVPTAAAFARELAVAVASLPLPPPGASAPPREGFFERLQSQAEKFVRIRPSDDVTEGAPAASAAPIARIAVKALRGDVAGARADLDKLPPEARAPAEAWIKKAEARAAALDASRRIAADALAGLGK